MVEVAQLRALGWDHPRCMQPMKACTREWSRLHPNIRISWGVRSLGALGDEPLKGPAEKYDLLSIDHPFCGTAEAAGLLRPFDELLSTSDLDMLGEGAVGPSHSSYAFGGHQWALATDAASQVSAFRSDLMRGRPLPETWEDALALASELAPRVTLPLAPAHAICTFLTLCANSGSPAAASLDMLVDQENGERAIEIILELYSRGPAAATRWEPPDVLEQMTKSDEVIYVPLTFSYITYTSSYGGRRPCNFFNIPSAGDGPVGATLGGVGLAISATSKHPREAAAFAAWASSADVQRTIVARSGGQPAARSAWTDLELDRKALGFYSNTIETIEKAWVRPRGIWWPPFQLAAGRLLAESIEVGATPRTTLARLEALYLDTRKRNG